MANLTTESTIALNIYWLNGVQCTIRIPATASTDDLIVGMGAINYTSRVIFQNRRVLRGETLASMGIVDGSAIHAQCF